MMNGPRPGLAHSDFGRDQGEMSQIFTVNIEMDFKRLRTLNKDTVMQHKNVRLKANTYNDPQT